MITAMLDLSSFSVSSLIAGFIFGVFGFAIFKRGRQNATNQLVVIGIAMMVYPYFVESAWLNWILGFALSYGAYYFWNF